MSAIRDIPFAPATDDALAEAIVEVRSILRGRLGSLAIQALNEKSGVDLVEIGQAYPMRDVGLTLIWIAAHFDTRRGVGALIEALGQEWGSIEPVIPRSQLAQVIVAWTSQGDIQ